MIMCDSVMYLKDIDPIIEEEGALLYMQVKAYLTIPDIFLFLNDDKNSLMIAVPIDMNKYNIHLYTLKEGRGTQLKGFLAECASYLYNNTACTTLLTFVKEDDLHLRMFMRVLGSKRIGAIEDAGMEGTEILYSTSKCNFPELVEDK